MTEENDEEEDSLRKKKFDFYVVINWKKEDFNIRKTEPKDSKVGPFDYVIEESVTMKIPKKKRTKVDIDIELAKEKVKEMVAEEI